MSNSNKYKILLYYPSNKRTIAMETLILETSKKYDIEVLTLSPMSDFQIELLKNNIKVTSYTPNISSTILKAFFHTLFLIKYCYKNDIKIIWSHLHPCNFHAVLAQYFVKAKVIIFRHHFHAEIKTKGFENLNSNELFMEKIISKLAKKIIVPSSEVYDGMINYEKINPKKIEQIPYIYNFDKYDKPNIQYVEQIRKQFPCDLLIIVAMRMIKLKRHRLVSPVFNKLIKERYNIQVLILDDGEEKVNLEQYVSENNLREKIHFLGFKTNIIDYISAADVIVHPSYTEASSSLIKEAGLLQKTVLVCQGVGDFDDYITNNENGFLISQGKEEIEFYEYLKLILNNKVDRNQLGKNLQIAVLNKFSVTDNNLKKYFKTI